MDPNATLAAIRELVAWMLDAEDPLSTEDPYTLAERVRDLDLWLSAGGFLPDAWKGAT